jgi:hypothetical protein
MEFLDAEGKPVIRSYSSGISVEAKPDIRKKAEDIRADIESTRQKITRTLESLQGMERRVFNGARKALMVSCSVRGSIKKHPVSAVLAGAGMGWLFARRSFLSKARRGWGGRHHNRLSALTPFKPLVAGAAVLLLKYALRKRK